MGFQIAPKGTVDVHTIRDLSRWLDEGWPDVGQSHSSDLARWLMLNEHETDAATVLRRLGHLDAISAALREQIRDR